MSDASKLRVFIVDDSTVFRSQIRASLEGQDGVEVVGFATDGRMACDALAAKKVDVVTLDLEMPVMDGLETLREFKRMGIEARTLVFSAQTKSGAEATLAALQLGASDFLCKPQLDPSSGITPAEAIRKLLLPKINQFRNAPAPVEAKKVVEEIRPTTGTFPALNWASFSPEVIVLASSTGGPPALERLFMQLRPPLSRPLLIVQHMPPVFTAALADRLGRLSGLKVVEATHGMPMVSGTVYIAPGDYHMRVEKIGSTSTVVLDQAPLRNSVRPCADFLFESVTSIYKNGVFGIVLTGMGADGRDGAIEIKKQSGAVFIQDKESCVVFGMPGSVYQEKAYDKMGTVDQLAALLNEMSLCGLQKAG